MTTTALLEHLRADRPPSEHLTSDVTVQEGSVVAMRCRVVDGGAEWIEAHVAEVVDGRVVSIDSHVPLRRRRPTGSTTFRPIAVGSRARLIGRGVSLAARLLPGVDVGDDPVASRRRLVERYVQEFKNEQRFQVFPRLFAAGFRHHFDFPGQPDTTASFVNVGVHLLDAFPDVRVRIRHLVVEGDLVAEHNEVEATHTGEWAGVPATGRPVRWSELHVYRVVGGRIVENWPWVDFDDLHHQIAEPAASPSR